MSGSKKNLHRVLRKIYYDPSSPVAFSGIHAVYKHLKKMGKKVKLTDIKEWLKTQPVYTLHKPVRHNFPRRRVIVSGIDSQWEIDLMDVSNRKRANDQITFLLAVIDIFSKKAWIRPLKNKTGQSITNAFKSVLKEAKGRVPRYVSSDSGREFLNKHFQQLLRDNNIRFFAMRDEKKAAVVERFNRTIRGKIWKYLTHKNTDRYIDKLQSLVKGYNNAYHRSIKRAPNQVSKANEAQVWKVLYGDLKVPRYKFHIGDIVRLSRLKKKFEKGATRNWTRTEYVITARKKTVPPVYSVSDRKTLEPVIGNFYEQELQKI